MSAYQIKRTPFFRRMFNNSRRNGQLQRLREEYERIQEFNDRTIELKMRQVRLKRLFRHIEDINQETTTLGGGPSSGTPAQSHSVRRQHTLVPMTPEEQLALARRQRLVAIERGRELGQEISRQNAQLAESGGGFYMRSELRQTTKVRAAEEARTEALERRQRTARRISYGNAQSRSNIERLVQRRERQRAIVVNSTPSASLLQIGGGNNQMQLQQRQVAELHPELVKRAMLQQRLQYGNSRSSSNMQRSQLAAAHRVMNCISSTTNGMPLADEEQLQLSLAIAGYNNKTSRNINNNNNKDKDNTMDKIDSDTDMDMHTAIELPDDDMPTTSHVAAMMKHPNPAAAHRWQCFSLTLPWSKIVEEQQRPAAAAQFGTNISITIGNDELGNAASSLQATDTATGTTDNTYHSLRGPSLLQEDLLQILELDNGNGNGQMP